MMTLAFLVFFSMCSGSSALRLFELYLPEIPEGPEAIHVPTSDVVAVHERFQLALHAASLPHIPTGPLVIQVLVIQRNEMTHALMVRLGRSLWRPFPAARRNRTNNTSMYISLFEFEGLAYMNGKCHLTIHHTITDKNIERQRLEEYNSHNKHIKRHFGRRRTKIEDQKK